MKRIELDSCFILHSRAFRNTSAIVDVFTQQHGLIGVVCRGVKTARSRYRGLLQPYIPLLISAHGRGELLSLNHIEARGQAIALDQMALLTGFYLNELLLRSLDKTEAYPELFQHYQTLLHELNNPAQLSNKLRQFELNLLSSLGYGLDFSSVTPGNYYRYQAEHGFIKFENNRHLAEPIFAGEDLLQLAQNKVEHRSTEQAAKRLMRLILPDIIGNRPLKSRQLMQQYHHLLGETL